jgi:hypothetical protein
MSDYRAYILDEGGHIIGFERWFARVTLRQLCVPNG